MRLPWHKIILALKREAPMKHFDIDSPAPRELPFGPPGHSGFHHTSERIDEILNDEWGDARRR
ncbi:MAG: hypothetical protein U0893_22445 [Chloroflexota bacterium]